MQIAGRDEINSAIAELVAMLRSDYGWQADVLMRLREAVNGQDRQAVEELFGSGGIWGGAGSVHDVSFCDAVLDERKRKLLFELVDAFASAGITNRGASETVAIYRRWLAESPFNRSLNGRKWECPLLGRK